MHDMASLGFSFRVKDTHFSCHFKVTQYGDLMSMLCHKSSQILHILSNYE